jgi:uncharacterized protein (DUF433 family)
MDFRGRIGVDPEIRFGNPCVRGTRISVGDILGFLATGVSAADITGEFPPLTEEDIRAALAFAQHGRPAPLRSPTVAPVKGLPGDTL